MTPEEANRLLRDPAYLRLHIAEAKKQLETAPIDANYDDPEVLAALKHRRATAHALALVENLFEQAEATLKAEAEVEEVVPGPSPGSLSAALLDPVPVAESE